MKLAVVGSRGVVGINLSDYIFSDVTEIVSFWDGKSKGTRSTTGFFEKLGKKVRVVLLS